MGTIPQQLRHALRKLSKSPGFAIVSIFTLAIGIGANTAIFSVVEGVLIRPLPYADSGRLVGLWHSAPGLGIPKFEQSDTSYTVYREMNRSFEEIAMVQGWTFNMTGDGPPLRLDATATTNTLFDVLEVQPSLGRRFTPADDEVGAEDVVILSHGLWQRRFGGAGDVIGRSIQLDGDPWQVIGVMPQGFAYPDADVEMWVPYKIEPEDLGRANFSADAIARLKPEATIESATADLNDMMWQMPVRYPGELQKSMMEDAQMSAFVRPMRDDIVGDVKAVLWILLGTVGLILLIACANVANLFLVRAEGRQREVALRTALGAGFGDMVKYFLTESLVLAAAGGALGMLLAHVALRGLIAISPITIPRIHEVGLNPTVLLFTVGISLFAGLAFGIFPILRYGKPSIVNALKEGGRGSAGRESNRARKVLVAAQVAMALILLAGSGLMARSFLALRDVDPGFDSANLLTFRISLPEAEYGSDEEAARFYTQLMDNLATLPGVASVGAGSNLPMTDGQSNNGLAVEEFPVEPGDLPPIVRSNYAAPGYFKTLGIPVYEGREFERRDHENRTGTIVVSRALARRFWPDESAIGKRMLPGIAEPDSNWYRIVGVVGDVRDDGLAAAPAEMVYFPIVSLEPDSDAPDDGTAGWTVSTMSVAMKTKGDPQALAAAVRDVVWSMNPRLPLANLRSGATIVEQSMAPTAFTMLLLGIAAGVALLLGTVGIYGVVSYVVSQRTREIGVRMALGAPRASVSRMVVSDAMIIAAAGVGVGLVGAFALTRLMGTLLFGVSATDPLTFAGVAMALFAVTAFASYLPARRAATVNPIVALRHE